MIKRLLLIACILLAFGVRYAWREHARQQALISQYAPALNGLSPQQLVGSDWSYSGPLGKLTLRFEQDGRLLVVSDPAQPTGRWEISGEMLSAYIPGADQPHQAVFARSTDELTGLSPHGLEPHLWSATRIHTSE